MYYKRRSIFNIIISILSESSSYFSFVILFLVASKHAATFFTRLNPTTLNIWYCLQVQKLNGNIVRVQILIPRRIPISFSYHNKMVSQVGIHCGQCQIWRFEILKSTNKWKSIPQLWAATTARWTIVLVEVTINTAVRFLSKLANVQCEVGREVQWKFELTNCSFQH